MKTAKYLAVAALLALGVSAQAKQVKSDLYCVVTLPLVANNYGLYGVVVTNVAPTYDSILSGVANVANVVAGGSSKKLNDTVVESYFWLNGAEESGKVYQYGLASETRTEAPISAGHAEFVAVTADTTLAALTDAVKAAGSFKSNTARATSVSVWNTDTQGYTKYWYCVGATSKADGWYSGTKAVDADAVAIKTGQAVYIKVGSEANALIVSL